VWASRSWSGHRVAPAHGRHGILGPAAPGWEITGSLRPAMNSVAAVMDVLVGQML